MIGHSTGLEKIVQKRVLNGFNYLQTLKTIYGADPRDVWNVFKKYKIEPARKKNLINSHPEFPEPHPVYSQWHITPQSTKNIIGKITGKNYEKICFLGCPVLGVEFQKRNPKKSVLLDIDKKTLDYAKQFAGVMTYDVCDEVSPALKGKFECVITDSPWYDEDIRLFIKRASEMAKTGGTVYLSLPGILTKPSILEERLNLQKWLSDSKLIVTELNPIVEYSVPPFEYMAYKDIRAFTGEPWRTGDWVKLKKLDNSDIKLNIKKNRQEWLEYKFGRKRVLLKKLKENTKNPELSHLYSDNSLILKTVSKRNALIPKIDIWTSRNAVLHINSGYNVVKNILDNFYMKDEKILGKIVQEYGKSYKNASANSIKKLRELVFI